MEQITYQEQVFWGISLSMADEDEVNQCYKYIKDQLERAKVFYTKCKQADGIKRKWVCGENIRSYPLCGRHPGILKDHLFEVIRNMVTTNLNIDEEKILNTLESQGYIDIYPCDRVYFIK